MGIELGELSGRDCTELLGLTFELFPRRDVVLGEFYAKGLHAWFLQQMQAVDPELSAYLHDGQTEKPFAMSRLLEGDRGKQFGKSPRILPEVGCRWLLHCLSARVVVGVLQWLRKYPPQVMVLGQEEFEIARISVSLSPCLYQDLWDGEVVDSLRLRFLSPTGFRRKGNHLPLPMPRNVFQSYLRRWNDFSGLGVEPEGFLDWVDDCVVVRQHRIETQRVPAGKQGLVTGFMGLVVFGVQPQARRHPLYEQYLRLFSALGRFAVYSGTGHKTTFGLGLTVLGDHGVAWGNDRLLSHQSERVDLSAQLLAERIKVLQGIFLGQRKRQGGDRAQRTAMLWATLLARRERGESLQDIATDVGLSYATAKSYVKLARRSLKDLGDV